MDASYAFSIAVFVILPTSLKGWWRQISIDQLIHTFHDLTETIMINNVIDELPIALRLDDTSPAENSKML
jgi:hypothetical protein